MPYWEDPKHNDPETIDGPDDVTLPATLHHMQAKAELNILVERGAITDVEAQQALKRWKARSELAENDMVEAAIDVLVDADLVDESEAESLREAAV